ncbi:hypothetical protein ACTXT7_003700 [Hymenolepis weldensis]
MSPAHILRRINRSNEISAIRVYYQNQPINAENCAMHRLFEQIIHQPAFTTLRTEKQLGYIVAAGYHRSNSFQGICVVIQSKYHPRDLDDHIEEFMADVEKMLENMSDKEFEEHKESVIATLLLKPKTMNQQCTKYWGQIVRQRYDFDLSGREVEAIKTIKKDDVQRFYRTYIKATSEARRKFAVYVTSEKAPATDKGDSGILIENPTKFKRTLPLRPIAVSRRYAESTQISGMQWNKSSHSCHQISSEVAGKPPQFINKNVLPFVRKHGINPVTGKKMKVSELIKLNFHKNADGKFHCPITFKVFNQNTHIVAIKPTGNVYAYEAVERLNIKTNSYQDLLTSEPFKKDDIITIQDPNSLDKFNISAFYHVKNSLLEKGGLGTSNIRLLNPETKETLSVLEKAEIEIPDYMYSNKLKKQDDSQVRDVYNTAHYSTGKAAASLTSTVMEPSVMVEPAILEDDVVRYRYVKSKGFVRLVTSFGNLNLELHCDLVPKTCENFIRLCESGYYNDTTFHRIQGGDPTGTGLGGDSIWGGSFPDEFKDNLKHDSRGVLSMANSGPNSNKSQLPCPQLNRKHTVFGKVVGGLDTLDRVELIETDKDDRPLEEVKLLSTHVFINPFKEVDEMLTKERKALKEREEADLKEVETPKPGNRREEEIMEAAKRAKKRGHAESVTPQRAGVGKFIVLPDDSKAESNSVAAKKRQKTVLRSTISDFSAW